MSNLRDAGPPVWGPFRWAAKGAGRSSAPRPPTLGWGNGVYPHLFRPSGAIERLRQTGNPRALQLHLGHASPAHDHALSLHHNGRGGPAHQPGGPVRGLSRPPLPAGKQPVPRRRPITPGPANTPHRQRYRHFRRGHLQRRRGGLCGHCRQGLPKKH